MLFHEGLLVDVKGCVCVCVCVCICVCGGWGGTTTKLCRYHFVTCIGWRPWYDSFILQLLTASYADILKEYQNTTRLHIKQESHITPCCPRHWLIRNYVTTERSFVDAFAESWKATISIVMSVRPFTCLRGTTRLPLDRFALHFMFEKVFFFRKFAEKIQVWLMTDAFPEYLCTFMIISPSLLLRMRNVTGEGCR